MWRPRRELLGADLPGQAPHGLGGWFDGIGHDVRIGFRMLLRNRLATAAAVRRRLEPGSGRR